MYRLYIDETGNADLGASRDPNHRYLSLTGVIIDTNYARHTLFPRLEALKQEYFDAHPDDPIVLHRRDIIEKNRPFHALRDPLINSLFDDDLLGLLSELEYTAITAVIDKLDHLERYRVWQQNPYHYCLEVLIERYVMWLKAKSARGDVLAEARNKRPDKQLKRAFAFFYNNGTAHVSRDEVQGRLTTHQLKLKPKTENVAGLQVADLIANPSAMYVRSLHGAGAAPTQFGGQIVKLLVERKYRRSFGGKIKGFGIKWLP